MDIPPVETVEARGTPGLLLLCDHARNRVPPCTGGGTLGLPPEDMARHIAFDVGARGVTLALADLLGAAAILSTVSRLVIDPNRGEDDPTLVMQLYDGSIVPGNRGVGAAEIARRRARFWQPYHAAIAARLDALARQGIRPALVGIHTMTRQLRGGPPRPWQISVLSGPDRRLADPLLARLRAEPDLVVGDNEPYVGVLAGDTMDRHAVARGLPHVLIEVRNDLVADAAGERHWAERLAGPLRDVLGLPGAAALAPGRARGQIRGAADGEAEMAEIDGATRTELEAAAFRALVAHLRARTDVQNIDLMNLAGFCRNCLARWYQEAAEARGIPMTKEEGREILYGMPYAEWVARYQTEADAAKQAAFAASRPKDH